MHALGPRKNEKKTMKAPGFQEFKFRVSFNFGFDLQVDLWGPLRFSRGYEAFLKTESFDCTVCRKFKNTAKKMTT